jgi:excisionase family DNA binding protein
MKEPDTMATTFHKEVLTTGEVARLCHVAPRTVSKWFDTGKLRGYRIPGSRDRRIPIAQVQAFMRAHGIPMDAFDGGTCRVLVLGGEDQPLWQALRGNGRYEVRSAANGFEAGMSAQEFRPHVVVIVVAPQCEDEAASVCHNIKSSAALGATKVLAVMTDDSRSRPWFLDHGFDECLRGTASLEAVQGALQQATNLIF